MGCSQSVHVHTSVVLNADYENYTSAGVCFRNNTHILGGVQQIKKEKMISGFGGKREKSDESYYHTALREMIEELFEIKPTADVIQKCMIIKPDNVIYFDKCKYVMLVYNFKHLNTFIMILHDCKLTSKMYEQFPTNVEELMFNRLNVSSEISNICLLPLETTKCNNYFMKDIEYIKQNKT